jgi:CheY-like chemotaxis protein
MSPTVPIVDDPLVRAFVCDLLEAEGRAARCAADGPDALRAAIAEPHNLVLANLWMRGPDGLGLTARLREHGLAVPVVAMGAHRFGLPREVPFVPKPFDLPRLFATLAALAPPPVPHEEPIPFDAG